MNKDQCYPRPLVRYLNSLAFGNVCLRCRTGGSHYRVTLHSGLEADDATEGLPTVRGRFHGQALSLATD